MKTAQESEDENLKKGDRRCYGTIKSQRRNKRNRGMITRKEEDKK